MYIFYTDRLFSSISHFYKPLELLGLFLKNFGPIFAPISSKWMNECEDRPKFQKKGGYYDSKNGGLFFPLGREVHA